MKAPAHADNQGNEASTGITLCFEAVSTLYLVVAEMTRKTARITGVTGQGGAYLPEFLLDKDCEVHGLERRSSSFNTQRIDHLHQGPEL